MAPAKVEPTVSSSSSGKLEVWFCPSRWLLAHCDDNAKIQTFSSHMCLADLNNNGESLLALIDFKPRNEQTESVCGHKSGPKAQAPVAAKSPYNCRMRIFRGHQLIYNHFLDDMPSCLLVTSVGDDRKVEQRKNRGELAAQQQQQNYLTFPINDDIYFYKQLKPSHRICLEDSQQVLDTLNKPEVDAWQMVKQNRVDTEAIRELLLGLSQEVGNEALTSHSNNFLALSSNEAREKYLLAWKCKGLQNGLGEQIMSMDTICYAAAREQLRCNSANLLTVLPVECVRILSTFYEAIIVGTEDRHLLIYKVSANNKSKLECYYRLASVPDHILVERSQDLPFESKALNNLKKKILAGMTYKILISCRNNQIYTIDQACDKKEFSLDQPARTANCLGPTELVKLKSNVLDMCWTKVDSNKFAGEANSNCLDCSAQNFVVACSDKRAYCFGTESGQCKWIVELQLAITSLVGLSNLQNSDKSNDETANLIGIGSQANRIDFYVSATGRIVDSIYFARQDYPQAMKFGRFGREDNCLCVVTKSGSLLVFVLKRTAKFAHGQCLSSAASYASDALVDLSQISKQLAGFSSFSNATNQQVDPFGLGRPLKLVEPASLPSAFDLTKASQPNVADKALDSILQNNDHNCGQLVSKAQLDTYLENSQLQIPLLGKDFVDKVLEQSRRSQSVTYSFAKHMIKLRAKIKTTLEQQPDQMRRIRSASSGAAGCNSRIAIVDVTGLGNIYRVSCSLRLSCANLMATDGTASEPTCNKSTRAAESDRSFVMEQSKQPSSWIVTVLISPSTRKQSSQDELQLQIKPYRSSFVLGDQTTDPTDHKATVIEKLLQFKLHLINRDPESQPNLDESISLDVVVLARGSEEQMMTSVTSRPILVECINVPLQ